MTYRDISGTPKKLLQLLWNLGSLNVFAYLLSAMSLPLSARLVSRTLTPRASAIARPAFVLTQQSLRTKATASSKMSASGTSSGHPIATLDVCVIVTVVGYTN